ncbi:MAG TPA: DUF87 domain-containing protein [Phycisphaerae bacterium]|jgi:hypothetical protein
MNPLKIGNVIRVHSGEMEVVLTVRDLDLEHQGRAYRIGQMGSYVTVPMNERTLVGFVTSIGRQELTVVDVEPQVIMHCQLLGEIRNGRFTRGVNESPVVGDDVWIAIHEDFEQIFGSFDQLLAKRAGGPDGDYPKSFALGRFAMNTEFTVRVLGSEFFAKHVAVLGNSGSGKSCTTAKILQEVVALKDAQVVLFDMHGEYRKAFSDDQGQPLPNVTCLGVDDLVVPYWLLRYDELETLLVDMANPVHVTSQIAFLRMALLEFKRDAARQLGLTRQLTVDTPIYFSLEKLKSYAENLNEARFVLNDEHLAFAKLALRSLPPAEQQQLMREQRCTFNRGNPEGETPHPLYFGKLFGMIELMETRLSDRRYEFLLRPIEHARQSRCFREYLTAKDTAGQMSNMISHLIRIMLGRGTPRKNLTIIDLSGIPFDIVDVTVAVVTRLLFDLNFWTPVALRQPILLVYEEAHNYIPRVERGRSFAKVAVERVAKEGRKYGVSAMIVSQRPSELSETVLAQCNSMICMRLNNPDDQTYVTRVVSDHFAGLIKMLPIMRPGEGFVIGDAVLMPLRTLIDLPRRTPDSGDVDFFRHWSDATHTCDIEAIVDHWWRQDRRSDASPPAPRTEPAAPTPRPDFSVPIPPPEMPAFNVELAGAANLRSAARRASAVH